MKSRVDVIIYGNVLLDLQAQIHGIEAKDGPMPFAPTPEHPSLGKPVASDDITGGIGFEGLAHLQRFLNDGGVLATLGTGSDLVLQTGIVRNVRPSTVTGISTPVICQKCGGNMRVVSFITEPNGIRQILDHLEKRNSRDPPPPRPSDSVATRTSA